MKKINFQKISIKNFLSFGENPVVLEFKTGLHIITGINRDKSDRQNGLGKSAMMESLYFCIFGTTIRDLKKDLIPNSFTNGVCEVILDFEVVSGKKKDLYKVIRTLNPSKLYFYKNDQDITRDSIKNTEEDLHSVLHATPSVFENCVIMTLNNTIPFMAKAKADKRKFIENIFNLDIFSKMLAKIKEEHTEKKKEYEIELTKMEESERSLKNLNIQRDTILSNRKNKTLIYEKRKIVNLEEKQKFSEELDKQEVCNLDEIKNNLKNIKKAKLTIDDNIDKLNDERSSIRATVSHNEKLLPKIGVSGSSCPVCLRSVNEHDKEYIKEEKIKINDIITKSNNDIKVLDEKIETLKSNKNKLEKAYEKYNKKINQIEVAEQKRKSIKDRIKQLDAWLVQLDSDIEELKSEKTEVDSFLKTQIDLIQTIKDSVNKCRYELNLMDTVKFIVSEDGVKSYIVKKILQMFNDRLRHYLTKMDANCICNFNEYFEEEIVNEKNKVCSYFNFSGAERKNIDFSCLFTFMDIRRLQGNVTYNISIYDELFDSCLDEKGIDLVTKIIKERVEKYNECVLVISHRKESVKSSTGDVIFLEKKGGITSRIDYNPFL
jgi:DNA repair exonuclease SbcCD ATPase subunit